MRIAGTGGLAAVFAQGRAPAFAQGTKLRWLRSFDFVPASDRVLLETIVPQAQKALGVALDIEIVNGNDLEPRTAAAIRASAGPDIILAVNNRPQLYAGHVGDVAAACEAIGKEGDGYYPLAKIAATTGGEWLGVPWTIVGALLTNRTSWFAEIGVDAHNFPQTWEEYRAAGKALKAKGHPFGQTLGHTFGDAPAFWYPYLWSWGGKEVEADGKTVAINSKETVESIKFAVGLWKDCYTPAGYAWDDSENNRAFLMGAISSTNNGASIYLAAKHKPQAYLTEKGKPLWQDIFHAPLPKGPAGRFAFPAPFTDMVMGYSQNRKAAADLLRWVGSPQVYAAWFASQQGYSDGPTRIWENDPVWHKDPAVQPFRTAAQLATRYAGYAGPSGRAAAEAVSRYVVTDMYARAVQGMTPENVAQWAERQLAKIYA
ncbi:MAG TPA: extracellular solute-binding protein [Stellaceae bacterium]|nr:extracellular solute-binding protein [Stellaceae bacterium]